MRSAQAEVHGKKKNAYIESFNGRFRDEYLNEHWFTNLQHALNPGLQNRVLLKTGGRRAECTIPRKNGLIVTRVIFLF
jgi:Integrase core domain